MHAASYWKVHVFLKHYGQILPRKDGVTRVLDVGSKAHDGQDSYRSLFCSASFAYTGLDLEPGENVDIVPTQSHVWDEIANETYDLCVSGQTFEHDAMFWVTFAEIARVLSPGGMVVIVAPSAGHVHRYPHDCWRFYPDSWGALCAMSGLRLVESYTESSRTARAVPGGFWRDSIVIACKPDLQGAARDAFYTRLQLIVAPAREMPSVLPTPRSTPSQCFADYEASVLKTYGAGRIRGLADSVRKLLGRGAG